MIEEYRNLLNYLHIRQKDIQYFIVSETGEDISIVLSPVSEKFELDDKGFPIYKH